MPVASLETSLSRPSPSPHYRIREKARARGYMSTLFSLVRASVSVDSITNQQSCHGSTVISGEGPSSLCCDRIAPQKDLQREAMLHRCISWHIEYFITVELTSQPACCLLLISNTLKIETTPDIRSVAACNCLATSSLTWIMLWSPRPCSIV
jgi:hypothetical protein